MPEITTRRRLPVATGTAASCLAGRPDDSGAGIGGESVTEQTADETADVVG